MVENMEGQAGWKQNVKRKSGGGLEKLWRGLLILSVGLMVGLGLICSEIGWGELDQVPPLLYAVLIDLAVLVVSALFYFGGRSRSQKGEKQRRKELQSIPFNPDSEWDRWISSLYTQNQQKARKLYRTCGVLLLVLVALGLVLAARLRMLGGGFSDIQDRPEAMLPGVMLILLIVLLCCLGSARKKSRVSDGQQVTVEVYRERLVMPCLYEAFEEARFLPNDQFSSSIICQSGVLGPLDYCVPGGMLMAKYRGVYLAGANLYAGYTYTTTGEDKQGHRTTETHDRTVFQGRWLEFHGQKTLSGSLLCVWSRQFCQNRGKKQAAVQGMYPVDLGDQRFERLFEVYAYDARDAYQFLTPALREGLERLLVTDGGKKGDHGLALVCAGNVAQVLISGLPRAFVPEQAVRSLTEVACRAAIRGEMAVMTDVAEVLHPSLIA